VIGEYANQIDADLLLLGNRGMDSGGQIRGAPQNASSGTSIAPVMTA